MSVNLVVLDGVVKSLALKYDAQGKPELRFTLTQTDQGAHGQPWVSYWPCCANGTTAERLASELEDGQHILVTSGKLCYRKRSTKTGEVSRMEILVWQADVLATPTEATTVPGTLPDTSPWHHEGASGPERPKGTPRQKGAAR